MPVPYHQKTIRGLETPPYHLPPILQPLQLRQEKMKNNSKIHLTHHQPKLRNRIPVYSYNLNQNNCYRTL